MKFLASQKASNPPRLLKVGYLTIAFVVFLSLFFNSSLQAQQNNGHVKGRVINEKGEPLAGAAVTVKGSSNGVNTNANGEFDIQAPAKATLVVTYVGFTTKEIKVNGESSLNVTLVGTEQSMEQVVVVGYGTMKRRDITGSVASVSGSTLKEVPAPNMVAALKGRTAGVDIVSNSATPGGAGQIRIRGNRTITNFAAGTNDQLDGPLLVVDGIPFGGSINDISSDDIVSLEILKDASATAIYGSRGAGGVILISTKRGRTGKAVMSFDSYQGISQVMGEYKVMNGQQYAQFKTDAALYNRSAWPTSFNTTAYPLTTAEQAALAAGISTDWQKLIYQQGFTSNNNISLSGGNETTQFGMGAGYYNETGIVPNQKYERYTIRLTIDHKISNRIKIGLNTLNTLSYSNTPGGAGVPSGLMKLTPLAPPYNPDGTVNLQPFIGSIDANTYFNPLTLKTMASSILARNRRIRTFNSFYTEVNIAKGLKYRLNLGLDYSQNSGNSYNGPGTYVNTNTSQAASSASISNTESWTYNIQNLLYYDHTFAEKHKIGLTGLFEVNKDHNLFSQFSATGVPADYILTGNFALANSSTANNGSFTETGLLSYMGRATYGYDNRYLLTATVRIDGSSTLSPGHQYFTYPAIAGGWVISNEKFMNPVTFVSNLKLRGGWGISGNRNVPAYSTLGLLSASTYNFGQGTAGQQPGYLVTSLPNTGLSWQSTSQWDVGVDFGFLKNRITGSIDVYDQRTKDILLQVALPQSNGASNTYENLGKTKGHGIEVNLSTVNVQARNGFTWSTDLNFYFNREQIVELSSPTLKADPVNGWFVGQPITVIFDVKKLGIWQTSDSAKGTLAAQTSPVQFPGQIRAQDVNGDGKIDQNDRQILGNFQPQWEGGITNRFSYKGFDLSVVIYARMGMKVLVPYLTADGGGNGYPFFNQGRVNQLKVNYWTRSNPTNDFPAPDAGTDRLLFGSTLGYQDGSFIKCRSINLGYEIPGPWLKKAGITSLRVYVTAVNPFIIYSPFVKDGFGPDPEGNGYGGAVSSPTAGGSVGAGGSTSASPATSRQISVNANDPATRQFNIGLNLRF